MVSGISFGTRLGPNAGDAVSTGHGESDLKKRRARKAEQKKKKTRGDGLTFQPRQELEEIVERFVRLSGLSGEIC